MKKTRNFEAFDATIIIFGVVFTVMSIFTIINGISLFAFNNAVSNYMCVILGALMLAASFGLLITVPTKTFRTFITGFFAIFIGYCVVQNNDIKNNAIDREYSKIDTKMTKSYAGIVDTQMYKEFLAAKKQRNVTQLNDYKENIKNYNSITAEQIMNLKLFYSSISSNDVKNKIDDMFNDKLVTETEYTQFQTYIANADLKDTSLALLSIVSR